MRLGIFDEIEVGTIAFVLRLKRRRSLCHFIQIHVTEIHFQTQNTVVNQRIHDALETYSRTNPD